MRTRILAFLLTGFMLAFAFPFAALAAPGAEIAVRLNADAGESERAAAEVLQDYLEKITGARPEVTSSGEAAQTIALVLRREAQGLRKGAYTLRAGDGKTFYIEAADVRGLFNGVYGFLRRVCGVEIYSPEVEKVPQNGAFTLPAAYDYR